ncbi:unnamed protein product [Diatraea saccharalis]|uniref:Ubiquitin-like-conjugating enzyme ATG10 n=1 Tax=Diatraea saccharalis TaxID=40085 RepID=A0A9N9QXK6_9NEOP|nr:unnamed protein product [Diatraea saccharalis]
MSLQKTITLENFVNACRKFCDISDRINDGWKLIENQSDKHKCYIKKCTFVHQVLHGNKFLLKTEYVIFFNLSYGVPSFSFNIWNSSGVLLTLDEIRQMSLISINKEDFYSVITQQEHPVLQRPYFIMHPCHTEALLGEFKDVSKNIIVTFLGLIMPLLKLDLPLAYGL